jgi:hypothetical protein
MKKSLFGVAPTFVFIFLSLISLCVPIAAQDLDDVTVIGKVVDANNAPVAGATVTARQTTTGLERTVTTDSDGNYRIIELPPGIYSIKTSMQGFGSQEKTDLETIAGQNVQLNFTLAPAGVAAEQIITLEGENETAHRLDAHGRRRYDYRRRGRRNSERGAQPARLVLTLGGTSEEALSTRDLSEDRNVTNATAPAEQGNFSLSGGASYSNNLTIDGLDNNDDRSANARFQPSLETIDEVQVVTNQFSAEYGRASGGRII